MNIAKIIAQQLHEEKDFLTEQLKSELVRRRFFLSTIYHEDKIEFWLKSTLRHQKNHEFLMAVISGENRGELVEEVKYFYMVPNGIEDITERRCANLALSGNYTDEHINEIYLANVGKPFDRDDPHFQAHFAQSRADDMNHIYDCLSANDPKSHY